MPDLMELNPGEVHLWYVATADAKQNGWLMRYHGLMSEDEHERHQRFVFEKDRDQFLIGRSLLRTTLSRYSNIQPDAWKFPTNEFGKPELDARQNPSRLRFNLSHCEGLVVLGIAIELDIGVDCENIDRKIGLETLAAQVFSASERAHLELLPASLQAEAFFRFWTLKEAYIKARGLGMSLPLREISFDLTVADRIDVSFNSGIQDCPENWKFLQPTFPGPVLVALAVNMRRNDELSIELYEAKPDFTS